MTAPAPTLLSSAAAPVAIPGATPAMAAAGTPSCETAGFAALLAREVPAPAPALLTAAPVRTAPAILHAPPAAAPSEALADTSLAPQAPAEPGKVLPSVRQKSAATPAALAFATAIVPVAANAETAETAEPSAKAEGDQPEATGTVPVVALAGPALPLPVPAAAPLSPAPTQPVPADTPQSAKPAELTRPTHSAVPAAPRPAPSAEATTPVPAPAANPVPTAQAAHPAAFAVASLVLEREIILRRHRCQRARRPRPQVRAARADRSAHRRLV